MQWRLILDGKYSGAWNMARDEALMLCAAGDAGDGDAINGDAINRVSTPVLRFYDWQPACVSVGRLQKFDSAFRPAPGAPAHSAFDLVRRPTGGRAVLHQHEITYCAVVHQSRLPRESRSVVGAYNWLSAGFIAGLQRLGVQAQLSPALRRGATQATNCFESAAQCDFLIDGKKLIGAAQCRKDDVILQHGSLLLDIDQAAWKNAVGGAMGSAVPLRSLGVRESREDIIEALAAGMKERWNISFIQAGLTEEELQMAGQLHQRKYSSKQWNETGVESVHVQSRT